MTTRLAIIQELHDALGVLATTAGLTATEASYGPALDSAIRAMNGGNEGDGVNLPDGINYSILLELFENYALRKLLNFYTFYIDTQVGPRKQSFAQVLDSITKRIKYPIITLPNSTYIDAFNRYNGTAFNINWFQVNSDVDFML